MIDIWVDFIQNGLVCIYSCDKIAKCVTLDHIVRFNDDFEIIHFYYIENNKSKLMKQFFPNSIFSLYQEIKCIEMTHLCEFHNNKLDRMGIIGKANCTLGQFSFWSKV